LFEHDLVRKTGTDFSDRARSIVLA